MALSIFEGAFRNERTRMDAETRRRRSPRYNYRTGQYEESASANRHEQFVDTAARTLSAVQMVCDALIPPSAGRYTVQFGTSTAMTEFSRKRITVTAEPLRMKGLRLADVADTLTGFVVHEIGHVEISQTTDALIKAWLDAEPGFARWRGTIMKVANVLDDVALEVWAKRRFPGVGHTFRVTTKFVAQDEGLPNLPPRRWNPKGDYAERFNFAVVSVRYRWFARWSPDEATRRERQWWIDWADEYGDPTSAPKRIEGIKVALAKIAVKPPEDEQPEPTQTQPGDDEPVEAEQDEDEQPETFDTGDDDSDDESEDDDDTTRGGNDDEDDEDEDGDDWDDEDGDGDDESDDEPEDDEGEGEGDDAEGDDEDGDDGEDEDEGDEPGSGRKPLGESEDGTADPYDEPWDTEDDDEGDESESESEGDEDGDESDDEGDEQGDDDGGDADDDTSDERDDERGDDRPDGGNLSEATLGEEGEGSSNAPVYDSFEQENLRDTVKTVDDYTAEKQRYDYRDQELMNEVQVEMKSEKVTDTHGFGSLKVVINL